MSEQTTEQKKDATPEKGNILVTGDALVDHHIYEGERRTVSEHTLRGLKAEREHGGACLIDRLLQACFSEALAVQSEQLIAAKQEIVRVQQVREAVKSQTVPDIKEIKALRKAFNAANRSRRKCAKALPEANWSSRFALNLPDEHAKPCSHHALATWKPYPLKPGDKNDKTKVWRAEVLMGYGHDEQPIAAEGEKAHCDQGTLQQLTAPDAETRIVVLDDGGFLFRQEKHHKCWLLPEAPSEPETGAASEASAKPEAATKPAIAPDWYVLKLSAPLAQGELWWELEKRSGQRQWATGEIARPDISDRLIVIVSANDLRRESARLSCGLSWESAEEDLHAVLTGPGRLSALARLPRHLVVSFGTDGALWLDNTDRANPAAHLVYDADGAEGEWAEPYQRHGEAFGYLSCLTASIAKGLALRKNKATIDLKDSIAAGLAAMRDLREYGHGVVEADRWPSGFPTKRLARVINKGTGDFANHPVPWTDADWAPYRPTDPAVPARLWRILESAQVAFGSAEVPSMLGLARQYVIYGTKSLKSLPHARFGGLITADRSEMETLRALRRLMLDYKADKEAGKPLSIGIFGPPGAGKSFGVKQVATDKTVFGEEGWMEFNLSQFRDGDLIGAFHQIRDRVLSGVTPVVFWDEFDSVDYQWLQYLLAPMQDGRFQEQQITHPIGKCVFIFAGGTAHRFEDFGPSKDADPKTQRDFRLKKGPDFHSRLDAYYNVLGPNQRKIADKQPKTTAAPGTESQMTDPAPEPPAMVHDPADICTPLRRAIMIRHQLGLSKSDQRLDIDRALLDTLLEVGEYKHGARSLEKLVKPLAPARPCDPVRPSQLPPPAIVAMHVEPLKGAGEEAPSGMKFAELVRSRQTDPFADDAKVEQLAEWIHLSWNAIYGKNTPTGEVPSPHSDKSYWELSEEGKEDNRAAARRIPDILALVGMSVVPREGGEMDPVVIDPEVEEHLSHHLDLLAQAEHDGWMDRKVLSGWRHGKIRNDAAKIHDCLIPFDKLAKYQKDKDRDSIRHFQAHLWKAGYRISFPAGRDSTSVTPNLLQPG